MSKPFDATTRFLVEQHPDDWRRLLGLPEGAVSVIDVDLSTVTAEADRVIRVDAPEGPYLLHLEFQSSDDRDMALRLARYNLLLRFRHRIAVDTCVVLLRPAAAGGDLTGQLVLPRVSGGVGHDFRYSVLRVWERTAEEFLLAGVGTLPLAPIAAGVTRDSVPGVVRAMESRIAQAAPTPAQVRDLWASTLILMGLRYEAEFTRQMLRGVQQMRESTTYQDILREGREEGRRQELRAVLIRQGRKRFGEPDAATVATLDSVSDIGRLEFLAERLLDVESWAELLAPEGA